MADADSRKGRTYVVPEVLEWLGALHAAHDPALDLAAGAPEREGMPAIHVAPSEGRLLQLLLGLVGARRVVEIGTLAGYSAIWIARALPPDGRLYTIESDPRHAAVARANLAEAGLADRVEVCVGPGVEVLPSLEAHGPFDAVFVDADKGSYDVYGRWARDHLREGGLLLGDNAFYFGRLLDPTDASAAAMRRFHEEAARAFDTVCIPTPDGLLLGRKR